MPRRTRIVLIADDPARLKPFVERFRGDERCQLIPTTDLREGLLLSEAVPADAVLAHVTLTPLNAPRILDLLRGRPNPEQIPLHWLIDATTRETLDTDASLDLVADTLLEDDLPPEEVMDLLFADPEEAGAHRRRLDLSHAVEPPAAPHTRATPLMPALPRRRLALAEGAIELDGAGLLPLMEKYSSLGASGALRVEHKGEAGELHFIGGRVGHAVFDASIGQLDGMAALVRFAHWPDGTARWRPATAGGGEPPRTVEHEMLINLLRSIPMRRGAS